MTPGKIAALVITMAILVAGIALSGSLIEKVDGHEIMVIQSPVSGKLTWHMAAGVKWQGFGKITIYPKRSIYSFACEAYDETQAQQAVSEGGESGTFVSHERRCKTESDHRIKIRFNDAAHAFMTGSIQYEMPLDDESLTNLHTRFGSPEAIQKQLVETVANKSVYMTGPLMSSKESYAEKRNSLLSLVEDQIQNGVYKTSQKEMKVTDLITGVDKTATIVEIVIGKNGLPERQEDGQLTHFGIKPFNLSITELAYDPTVERQIQQQQGLTMQVQTSIAEARQAEQRAITAAKEGEANAAKAKWEQEVIKAKEVTAAEQRVAVAELNALAAEQTKREQILLGEGEAARKRLVMEADGALEVKIAAAVEINKAYATAIQNYTGQWVPAVIMGQSQGGNIPGGSATQLVDLLTAKTARDLGIDLAVSGTNKTKGKQP